MPPPEPVTMATLPVKSKRTMGSVAGCRLGRGRGAHESPVRLRLAMTFSATALTPVDRGQPM